MLTITNLLTNLGSGIVCGPTGYQEMEVEWTLEKETENRTGNENCWHRICFPHELMSSVFLYCVLDYLAMIISLHL